MGCKGGSVDFVLLWIMECSPSEGTVAEYGVVLFLTRDGQGSEWCLG